MHMNMPNKLTITRVVMAIIIIIILLGDPLLSLFGLESIDLFINETLTVELKYIIAGILFILASLQARRRIQPTRHRSQQ